MEGEAFRYDPTKSYDSHPQLSIGRMTDVCAHCEAYKWPGEAPGMCCSNGKVKLSPLKPPPEPLESLMSGTTSESKHFLENIRQYNSCFQMTSFGASEKVFESGFRPTFKVQGQVYHRVGSLLPSSDEEPKFLQIYFMGDERKQADRRCKTNPGTRGDIVMKLQQMLHQYNTYVHSFKTALERMPSDEYNVIIKADKTPVGEHARRFNEPLDGKCTRRYPRQLLRDTETGEDGYPLYRRRKPEDGGIKTKLKMKINNSNQEIEIDNKWIVPYCPLLSRLFEAHINVEYCNSVKSIKYICKYVNKGSDQAVFGLENDRNSIDEIKHYQLGRYISSNEAIWRILDYPIHERHPTVIHLAVHLENGQRIYFTEDNLHEKMNDPPRTTLTAFFLLCQKDDYAKTLLYCDVPKYYTWDASEKVFKRRIQGTAVHGYPNIRETDALGRAYTVHPNNFECFFLRLLLHTVRGPTSFEAIRTVNGQVCATFREACQLNGLLEDDDQWDATMSEAATIQSPQD
ncbi:unnamed protein product [Rotaria magnacalcarata]|uniref:Helitron helicase-like domain-containing protein n=2 Tax=Rotaria magnacalcarata TaxID=392030 RepID=A0A815XJZ5_9BILA|nr:unnamed protein product [Rotaria magnacalcarata]